MKRSLLIVIVFLFVSSTAFSQFSWGVGGAFGTKSAFDGSLYHLKAGFGVSVKGIYDLSETTALQAGFNYYFPTKIGSASVNQMVLSLDFNYNFFQDEALKVYVLGGVNYTGWHAEVGEREGDSYGVGFHGGIGLRIEHFLFEVRYELEKDIDDPIVTLVHEAQVVGTFVYIF